jgi:TonB-dependent starch-binding outer membrane protein SusC
MRELIMMIGLVLSGYMLHAQTYYAVGVLDSKAGEPIIGASIKIKSTGEVLTTGESGNVVVFASPTDSLLIQCKGYKDRAISLVNQSLAISIVMVSTPKVVAAKPKKKKTLKLFSQ